MYTLLMVLILATCLLLAGAVLLQAGQGGGLASLGGGAGDNVVGGRQAETILTKGTWWLGGAFMVLALSVPAPYLLMLGVLLRRATGLPQAAAVILSADDGKIITTLPIGKGTDGGGFNPNTMEAFSSQGDGTLTIIKENSPTSFEVEQTVKTKPRAKTCTLDTKNNQIVLITTEPAPAPPAADGASQPAGRGGPSLLDILVVGR